MPINHRLSAIELEEDELTTEEKAILDHRLEDFRRNAQAGTPAEQLKGEVLEGRAPSRPLLSVIPVAAVCDRRNP